MTADSTGEPVLWCLNIYLRKESQRAEQFRIFYRENRLQLTAGLLSPTGGVKGMYPAPHIHEHLATANCVHLHAQHEQPGAHCEQWHGHHKAH